MYRVELYNNNLGIETYIADITPLVEGLKMSFELNNVDECSFDLNADAWANFCRKAGIDARLSIMPLKSEIKIKYNDSYLPACFEVQSASMNSSGEGMTISVDARSTLIKLDYRITFDSYNNRRAGDIVIDLIEKTQSRQYGDYGITFDKSYIPPAPTTRNYTGDTVMKAITDLSDDISGGFDFWFDENHILHFSEKRGSEKKHISLVYGGEFSNVIKFDNPNDGNKLSNSVVYYKEVDENIIKSSPNTDGTSAMTFGLREKSLSAGDNATMEYLNQQSKLEVQRRKELEDTPKISVSGQVINPSIVFIGDVISYKSNTALVDSVDTGRITKIDISLDDAWLPMYDLEIRGDI